LALHRAGLAEPTCHQAAGGLLPHRFTLARAAAPTGSQRPLAVCFLLRSPSAFAGWTLSSALLYGVRTFLDTRLATPV